MLRDSEADKGCPGNREHLGTIIRKIEIQHEGACQKGALRSIHEMRGANLRSKDGSMFLANPRLGLVIGSVMYQV